MFSGILDSRAKTALSSGDNLEKAHEKSGDSYYGGGVRVMKRLLPVLLFGFLSVVAGPASAQDAAPVAAFPVASSDAKTPAAASPAANAPDATGSAILPPSSDAPPADVQDPLAEFRRAQQAEAPAPANTTPAPTPGGFQQPGADQPADQYYNLNTLSAEDVEAKRAELEQKAREQAFDAALNGMMPMTPDQIRALLDKYKVTRDVSESRIGGMPKPEVTVQTVSLDPGVTPPVIKLSPGHVTSITMMDITGQPWPVQDVSWGGNFEVISPGDGGHLIRVSPMGAAEVGNMSVQLVGLKTPVTFTLETQLDVVQYRFDARIPEYGPNATPPIIDPGLTIEAGSDKALTQILDGVPPGGTEKLTVNGVDGRTSVFRSNGTTYLRTPLTLLSPGWSASVKSADGMTVYVVNNSPVLLLSDHGKLVRAQVEENKAVQ